MKFQILIVTFWSAQYTVKICICSYVWLIFNSNCIARNKLCWIKYKQSLKVTDWRQLCSEIFNIFSNQTCGQNSCVHAAYHPTVLLLYACHCPLPLHRNIMYVSYSVWPILLQKQCIKGHFKLCQQHCSSLYVWRLSHCLLLHSDAVAGLLSLGKVRSCSNDGVVLNYL
jgi:hypothetical protein